MDVRFLGPLNQVTGSCYWLRDAARRMSFLVDCGAAQGERLPTYVNNFPFDPATLDFVLLTHAHHDHWGMLPKLAAEGFRGPVYCTTETEALVRVSLEARREAEASALNFQPLGNGTLMQRHALGQGVFVEAYPSGHIIGAVSYRLTWKCRYGDRSLVFSGDIGAMRGNRSFTLTRPPMRPPVSDYVVMESTYGARSRSTGPLHLTGLMGDLARLIDRVKAQRGVLLIPTFSIERTHVIQFVLDELYRCDPSVRTVPLYVHSPSARDMGVAYANAWSGSWFDRAAAAQVGDRGVPPGRLWRLNCSAARRFDHDDDTVPAQQVVNRSAPVFNDDEAPAIVLASGGMLDSGTVCHYLPALLGRASTIIAVAGYVSRETTGGWLTSIAAARRQGKSISAEDYPRPEGSSLELRADEVNADVCKLDGYSGHADQRDLVDWISEGGFRATRKVFLTHGDRMARKALRDILEARRDQTKLRIERPARDDRWFDLDRGVWMDGAA